MRFSSSPRGTVILAYRHHRDSVVATTTRPGGFGFGHPYVTYFTYLSRAHEGASISGGQAEDLENTEREVSRCRVVTSL